MPRSPRSSAARSARALRRAAIAAAALVSAPAAGAQDTAAIAARVDSIFRAVDGRDRPGCAVGVYRDGRVAFARGYGMASLEHAAPITPQTVFYVGSVSKQFTAMSVALLAKDGKLSLDDDVRKHVPEFPDLGHRITVRHLVHHTSGLREQYDLLALQGSRSGDVVTQQDVLEFVRRHRGLNFAPGTEHLYNNTGYILLSTIVERVSGRPLREFARERIFAPLGMASTQYVDDRSRVIPGRAYGHAPRGNGWALLPSANYETTGAGGVYSTVEDLAKWDASFLRAQLGGPDLVQLVTTPGSLVGGRPLTYAFGLTVDEYRGLPRVRHGGSLAGYRAVVLRFPGERFGMSVLCNHSNVNPEALAMRAAAALLGDRLAPVTQAASGVSISGAHWSGSGVDAAIDAATGLYWDAEREEAVRLAKTVEGFALMRGNTETRLRAVEPGRFAASTGPVPVEVRAEPTTGARVQRIVVGGRAYARVAERDVAPAPRADYVGRYRSEEVDADWEAVVRGDTLVLRGPRDAGLTLRPVFRDVFTATNGTVVRFERTNGRVTGFLVTPGRSRRVQFARVPR